MSQFRVLKGFSFCFLLILSSCAPYFHQPLKTSRARLGAEAPTFNSLVNLPPPNEKVVAAVYKFRDQTGQYKPTIAGSSFSTAVTQGATSILLRALEESGWFTVIERENLGNLLNERKIIRSSRAEYSEQTGQKEPLMPPLLFAGVVLEGGIISYDANMMTGGAGLRYFGAGASGQYREDRVTVYLRAISTSNGKVLKTVYTTKTILSQQVDVGVFRFVKFMRLLETETGFTYNEPSEMAVKEAIEKAVESLVIEGVIDGLWQFNAPAKTRNSGTDTTSNLKQALNQQVIDNYLKEKNINSFTDELGRILIDRRSRFGFGAGIGGIQYAGDFGGPRTKTVGELMLTVNSRNSLNYFFKAGFGKLEATNRYNATVGYTEFGALYRLFPKDKYTPFLTLSGGILGAENAIGTGLETNFFPTINTGLGGEYLIGNRIGIRLAFHHTYIFSDNLDGVDQGRYNDYLWSGNVGVTYYLGALFDNFRSSPPK